MNEAMMNLPYATAIPTAAADQRVAAAVNPDTRPRSLIMAPAPRKPMPLTTCAAMRVRSAPSVANWESNPNTHDPTHTAAKVRTPAAGRSCLRSQPMKPPRRRAISARKAKVNSSSQFMPGFNLQPKCKAQNGEGAKSLNGVETFGFAFRVAQSAPEFATIRVRPSLGSRTGI